MYCGNWVCGLLVIQGLWIHISNKQSNRITAHRRWKLAYITSSSHLLYLGIVSWRGNNVALKYGTRLLVACNWDHDNLLNCIICLAYLLESTIHISKKQNSSVVSKWRFFDRFLFYYSFVIVFFKASWQCCRYSSLNSVQLLFLCFPISEIYFFQILYPEGITPSWWTIKEQKAQSNIFWGVIDYMAGRNYCDFVV